jgi:hypothetical protein
MQDTLIEGGKKKSALRVVVMPLAEFLGSELPKSLSQSWVLVITGILGVLVTSVPTHPLIHPK